MSIKNYFFATLLGSAPAMFVTIALGEGVEKFIEKNEELSISAIITSPDIYWPIFGFFIIIILAFIVKQFFFKKNTNESI